MTYTHTPSPQKIAVNAGNAEPTADPNTVEPTDTSAKAVGQPKPSAKKTYLPKPPPTNRWWWR